MYKIKHQILITEMGLNKLINIILFYNRYIIYMCINDLTINNINIYIFNLVDINQDSINQNNFKIKKIKITNIITILIYHSSKQKLIFITYKNIQTQQHLLIVIV